MTLKLTHHGFKRLSGRAALLPLLVAVLLTVSLLRQPFGEAQDTVQGSVVTPAASALSDQAPLAPSLNLVRPGGDEKWEAGTQEFILWGFHGLTGDVRLEYSTNGTQSWKTIIDATPGMAGSYMWTVPDDSSTNAYVRVSSTLDDTISDTNDAPFTLLTVKAFEDSYAVASPVGLQGGDTTTYTIVLYESDDATIQLTDTLPSSVTYVTETLQVEPDWKAPAEFIAGDIRWSGRVTRTVPVRVKFQAQVTTTTSTLLITNPIQVSRAGATPLELTAIVIVNGSTVYLPVALKNP